MQLINKQQKRITEQSVIFFVLLVNYTFKCNAYYVVSAMPFVSLPCKALLSLRNTSNRGPHGILCTHGEKAQTSIRVSIIAYDDVISKAKLCDASPVRVTLLSSPRKILYSGPRRDTVYPLGKGVCERKTDICRLRRLSGQE